jgi:Histidine kinase-, DNA gyrase B-, and HSP90-like ATPase
VTTRGAKTATAITPADARPTRRFFIEMLTSDITLDEAVLDLLDNSVDALIRTGASPVDHMLLFSQPAKDSKRLPQINVEISENRVRISDNCGGMTRAAAQRDVFRLGRRERQSGITLGVYGIGMKRALFKIGNKFEVQSRAKGDPGFCAALKNVDDWATKDEDRWNIPLRATKVAVGHTVVEITDLRDDVRLRVKDPAFLNALRDSIALTYSFFLGKFVRIKLNNKEVDARSIPFGTSKDVTPGITSVKFNELDVEVFLYAGVADRANWKQESAGWYVLCNGRMIVSADKSSMTGWSGPPDLPRFVPKFRGFVGIAIFFGPIPENLPWRTTKRGLNVDSLSYQRAKPEMLAIARPVIAYLNSLQKGDDEEQTVQQREATKDLKSTDFRSLKPGTRQSFRADTPNHPRANIVRVQYDITTAELRRARRAYGHRNASARTIGRYAFDYFLKRES